MPVVQLPAPFDSVAVVSPCLPNTRVKSPCWEAKWLSWSSSSWLIKIVLWRPCRRSPAITVSNALLYCVPGPLAASSSKKKKNRSQQQKQILTTSSPVFSQLGKGWHIIRQVYFETNPRYSSWIHLRDHRWCNYKQAIVKLLIWHLNKYLVGRPNFSSFFFTKCWDLLLAH